MGSVPGSQRGAVRFPTAITTSASLPVPVSGRVLGEQTPMAGRKVDPQVTGCLKKKSRNNDNV